MQVRLKNHLSFSVAKWLPFAEHSLKLLRVIDILQHEQPEIGGQASKVEDTLAAALYLPDLIQAFQKFFPSYTGVQNLFLGALQAHLSSEEHCLRYVHSLSLDTRAGEQMAQTIRCLTADVVQRVQILLAVPSPQLEQQFISDTRFVMATQAVQSAVDICDALHDRIEGDEIWRDSALVILASGGPLLHQPSLQMHSKRLYDAILSPKVPFYVAFDALMFQYFGFHRRTSFERNLLRIESGKESREALDPNLTDKMFQRYLKGVFRKLADPCCLDNPFRDVQDRAKGVSITERLKEIFVRFPLNPLLVSSIRQWTKPNSAALDPWSSFPWVAENLVFGLCELLFAVLASPDALSGPRGEDGFRLDERKRPFAPGTSRESYTKSKFQWYIDLVESVSIPRIGSLADLAAVSVVENGLGKKLRKCITDAEAVELKANRTRMIDALSRAICALVSHVSKRRRKLASALKDALLPLRIGTQD
jgi:hypothetical protein